MTDISKVNARIFSRLGQRGAIFGVSALDVAKQNDELIILTADLATLSGLDRYIKSYPTQFINVGIAEQNLLGIAAGLSAEGYSTVVTTYATFLTMRSCEQIRHYMGYMQLPIVAVGSGAGLSQGFAGNTHYTIEDISMMRAIPGLTILSPADAGAAVCLFEKSIASATPTYIRLTGTLNCPIVYDDSTDFAIGGSNELCSGDDLVILATGTLVYSALKTVEILREDGLSVQVVDMYSIKPIDTNRIMQSLKKKLVVTIEEHSKLGGLGAAVAEVMSNNVHNCKLLRLGIGDKFDLAGDYEFLLTQNRLMPEQIAEDIKIAYNELG